MRKQKQSIKQTNKQTTSKQASKQKNKQTNQKAPRLSLSLSFSPSLFLYVPPRAAALGYTKARRLSGLGIRAAAPATISMCFAL